MGLQLPKNYKELPDEVLLDFKTRIERDLDRIKAQIGEAKARVLSGNYADPIWWARVNTAKRAMGRYSQMIQTEFNARKKIRKQENIAAHQNGTTTFERVFMRIAKRKLTEEVYESIMRETQEEANPCVKGG